MRDAGLCGGLQLCGLRGHLGRADRNDYEPSGGGTGEIGPFETNREGDPQVSGAERTYSDEELTAFLDGEAEDRLADAIAADMARDHTLAEQIDALGIPKLALQGAFAGQLSDAPAMPALPPVMQSAPAAPNRSWVQGMLGLGTGLAAGIVLAIGVDLNNSPPARTPAPMGWKAAVATYQMLYTADTLSSAGPANPEQLTALSEAVSLDLSALASVEGLEFRRAQQLGFNGKALIQVAYSLPDGTPFAICILRSDTPADMPNFQHLQGMQAANWHTGTHGVLIIGGDDGETIRGLAPKVQALL